MVSDLKKRKFDWIDRLRNSWSTLINKISKSLKLSNLITYIANFSLCKYVLLIILVSAAGILINATARNRLPFFNVLLFILVFCLFSSHYTTVRIKKMCDKLDKESMIGTSEKLILRQKFIQRLNCNIVYIPTLLFGFLIPFATFQLINIELDWIVCVYCFFILSIVTMSCTVGAVYFLFLLMFMSYIRMNAHKINGGYDAALNNSKWINDIIRTSGVCNKFFSLVGTAFILAFCLFSFSGKYGINYNDIISVICVVMFWFIIVVFIILGAIISTVWSRITIRKIVEIILSNAQKQLYDEFIVTTDLSLKVDKGIKLSLLNINRNQMFNLNHSLFSGFISLINFAASLEATTSLIKMIVNLDIPSVLSNNMQIKDIYHLTAGIMCIFVK